MTDRLPRAHHLSLGCALLLVACGEARSRDPVLLALGAQTVHRSDFERHLRDIESRGTGSVEGSVRAALLEPFLEERVLVLEARARGLLQPGASDGDEEAAVRKLLADEVLSRIDVTDEEIGGYYADHAADFRVPETVVVRQILVPTENEARDVRRRLRKEPRSFEVLARSRSRGPEASRGGLMGAFSRGQLPAELEAAVFDLPEGGMSEIVATPLGFHVLRVDSRQPARDRGLEECRSEIHALLMGRKSDQATRRFVRDLLARAKVNHEAAEPAGSR